MLSVLLGAAFSVPCVKRPDLLPGLSLCTAGIGGVTADAQADCQSRPTSVRDLMTRNTSRDFPPTTRLNLGRKHAAQGREMLHAPPAWSH